MNLTERRDIIAKIPFILRLTKLLSHLRGITKTQELLVGTWRAASWAISFYQKQGFKLLPDKDALLTKYWDVPRRQAEVSVVLSIEV